MAVKLRGIQTGRIKIGMYSLRRYPASLAWSSRWTRTEQYIPFRGRLIIAFFYRLTRIVGGCLSTNAKTRLYARARAFVFWGRLDFQEIAPLHICRSIQSAVRMRLLYSDGVSPVSRLNTVLKYFCSIKPTSAAICAIGVSDFSACFAFSMRMVLTYFIGGIPIWDDINPER